MPCLLVIIALLLPRVTLFFIYILTSWFSQAFDGWILPLLGFFFMPYTVLASMYIEIQHSGDYSGWNLVLMIIAVIVDLGIHKSGKDQGSSRYKRRRR